MKKIITQIDYGHSDDYAVLNTGRYEFYFGYEHEIEDNPGFYVKENGKIIKEFSSKELDKIAPSYFDGDVRGYLICGIGLFLLGA